MADVSRETPAPAPPVPAEARGVFPVGRLDLAIAYAEALAGPGVVRGLIGPRETTRLWTRHILNSAILAEVVPHGASVADIGSGAGLPGIPLAIARPDLAVTLVEPLLRRATFLQETIEALGLENVAVMRSRGEDLHRQDALAPGFDVVTSRAVSSLSQLLDWCMPLVAPTGAMVALKGTSVQSEIAEAGSILVAWGVAPPEVIPLGVDLLVDPTQAVRVRWAVPGSVSWPARRRTVPRPQRQGRSRRGR